MLSEAYCKLSSQLVPWSTRTYFGQLVPDFWSTRTYPSQLVPILVNTYIFWSTRTYFGQLEPYSKRA